MNWREVCADPLLRDLPYKIELNEWGSVVMSPASSRHAMLQGLIQDALRMIRKEGMVFPECPIQTAKGVKVPDVVWASEEFLAMHSGESPFPRAPELCVEVISPANSSQAMEEKRELYFAQGAEEVWLCDEQGRLTFHDISGRLSASRLFPGLYQIQSVHLH